MAFPNIGQPAAASRPVNPLRTKMLKAIEAKPTAKMPVPHPPAALKGSVAPKMPGPGMKGAKGC